MKRLICFVFIALLLVSMQAATKVQMKEYPFYGALYLDFFRLTGGESDGSIAGLHPTLKIGYNYSPYFALQLNGGWGTTKPSDAGASGFMSLTTASNDYETTTTVMNADFGLRLNALPKAAVNPYLTLGLGKIFWSVENDNVTDDFDWGKRFNNNSVYINLGLENKISDRLSLNLEIAHRIIFGDTDNMLGEGMEKSPDKMTQLGFGVSLNFGRGVYERVDLEGIEAVHFEFNSTRLTKDSKVIVKQIAEAMKVNPALVIEVRGFTDNTGSDEVNMRMSKKRSITVKKMLIDMGIKSHRIITTSMGHQNPVATNTTPEGRAMNRRVEFYILEE